MKLKKGFTISEVILVTALICALITVFASKFVSVTEGACKAVFETPFFP